LIAKYNTKNYFGAAFEKKIAAGNYFGYILDEDVKF
jgi:hypothetical protein